MRESPKLEVNSYQDLQKNADGSVDVYFGATAPPGKEVNWVYTAPGKQWMTLFRLYGPERPIIEKTWRLPDIEQLTLAATEPDRHTLRVHGCAHASRSQRRRGCVSFRASSASRTFLWL